MSGSTDHGGLRSAIDPAGACDVSMDRRDFLLATGATVTLGAAASPNTNAAPAFSGTRIDAHTHFSPLKFVDFAEKAEGLPFVLKTVYAGRPALTDAQARLDQLDRNNIDLNVLVPVPWIEAFPKLCADRTAAAQAASD